jgi:hypothetical protein
VTRGESNSHASRHDGLSVACLPVSPLGHVGSQNRPCGNRTRLCGLRGRRPEPIDERADASSAKYEVRKPAGKESSHFFMLCTSAFALNSVRRAGFEPAQRAAGGLQPLGLACAQPTGPSSTKYKGPSTKVPSVSHFVLSTSYLAQASPTGFEPVISTVTEWRALQAAPRGRN